MRNNNIGFVNTKIVVGTIGGLASIEYLMQERMLRGMSFIVALCKCGENTIVEVNDFATESSDYSDDYVLYKFSPYSEIIDNMKLNQTILSGYNSHEYVSYNDLVDNSTNRIKDIDQILNKVKEDNPFDVYLDMCDDGPLIIENGDVIFNLKGLDESVEISQIKLTRASINPCSKDLNVVMRHFKLSDEKNGLITKRKVEFVKEV